ncbi:MAG: TauD/TfdA family dioxygenase [Actinomycetota bacterium]|nr:TauD/TfdA family dioxygenase [Actinomycetota bacterium]
MDRPDPIPHVDGPAVWRGEDIADDPTLRLDLTDDHVAELRAALDAVRDRPLREITAEDFPLPTLGPHLDATVDELLDGRGFALLRGVPVDDLSDDERRRIYWGIGQHLGVPISQNDAGDHLVRVRSEGLDFSNPTVRAYQTDAQLDYHSDSSDIVGLLCVRPAKEGGVSTIVSAGAVFDEAVRRRPDLLDELTGSWWWDRRKPDLATSFFSCRIFADHGGRLFSYYGRAHIESATRSPDVPELTDRQIEALDVLDAIANDPAFVLNMHFRPGDIQFLNNRAVWHARTAYVDHPEPERRRELLRLWLTVRRPLDLPEDFAAAGITNRAAAFG